MVYSPSGKFLWDCWTVKVNNSYHIFYLQADNSMHPDERHDHASVGHAVSRDFIIWKQIRDAIHKGPKGHWDDLSIWTGSIIKHDGQYYFFYTGRSKKEPLIQRIGLATSYDLLKWRKSKDNPIKSLEPNLKFYSEKLKKNFWKSPPAWRDPFVFKDPKSKKFFMTISAKHKSKSNKYNACIGIAESEDLLNWIQHKPIIKPELFDEMETSQIVFHNKKYYVFFSTPKKEVKGFSSIKNDLPAGLYCYYSENIFGPYVPVNKNGLVLDYGTSIFSAQLIKNSKSVKTGHFLAYAWLYMDEKGQFMGKLSQLFNIKIEHDVVSCNVKSTQLTYLED